MAALLGLRAFGALLLTLYLLGLSPPAFAQNILYEYDALGRLVVVASPEGASKFEYDAVGNLLRIITRRASDTPDPVAIFMLVPDRGPVGTEVHLYGKGFGETPAANQVAFNGTAATVTSASASRLVVTVPAGAATGLVTVTAPGGSATSLDPFTVTQQLAVTPTEATVALGTLFDFQATLDGTPTSAVTWRVNGVEGGNAQLGTITATGTYTAPATLPALQPVPIAAVLTADPAQVATAQVRISRQPGGLGAAAPVSVIGTVAAPALAGSAPVSVASAALVLTPTASAPVSVASAASGTALAGGTPLSVTRTPVILAVSPTTAPQGATALALTLTGANFQGAGVPFSALQVLRAGQDDGGITIGPVTVAPDGTSLSTTLTIAGGSPLGVRLLRVTTSQGSSTGFELGTNTFTVTAP